MNSLSDSCLASISFSIIYETSPFPLIWGVFLCLSIVCETLPVILCLFKLLCSDPLGLWCKLLWWNTSETQCYSILDVPNLLILGCGLCWFCVRVWFLVLVETFFVGSFPPAGYLRASLSPTSCFLLCRCGQVVLVLVLLCVQRFEASLLLLFICLF